MSASLVGSEMCIRDRLCPVEWALAAELAASAAPACAAAWSAARGEHRPCASGRTGASGRPRCVGTGCPG
eukprot:3969529-Alexandrium_andersonii.AAC.1